MKTKNIATFYAVLAAALYAINVPLSKLLLNHIMVKDTISLQHTHEHEHIHTHEHSHGDTIHTHEHKHIHTHLHIHGSDSENHTHKHELTNHQHSHCV